MDIHYEHKNTIIRESILSKSVGSVLNIFKIYSVKKIFNQGLYNFTLILKVKFVITIVYILSLDSVVFSECNFSPS